MENLNTLLNKTENNLKFAQFCELKIGKKYQAPSFEFIRTTNSEKRTITLDNLN